MQPENQQGNWAFRNEDAASQTQQPGAAPAGHDTSQPVTWTASEFIAHHKDPAWYGVMAGSFLVLCTLIYVFTKDIISVVTIALVVVLFLIISGRKPQQRAYSVDSRGVTIGDKFYPYELFKSFAVSYEGAIGCITFMPLKRFMPEISIYYAPDDEAKILDVLAASLPNDQRREHGVDRLMKRLHF